MILMPVEMHTHTHMGLRNEEKKSIGTFINAMHRLGRPMAMAHLLIQDYST